MDESKVLSNKHLIKIVVEYISFNLIYENELLDKTKDLPKSLNLGDWYYYDKLAVCNHPNKYGHFFRNQYKIFRYNYSWMIKIK